MESKEEIAIKKGRIFKHNQKEHFKIKQKFWYVWYRSNNKEDPRILFQTGATTEESAKEQKDKLKESGIFSGYEVGIVSLNAEISDFHYLKDVNKNDYNFIKSIDLKNFIVIDTETTGFASWDQVIDLAAVKVVDYEIVDRFQCFIIPTCKLKPDSIKVHGLTKEFLDKNGIPSTQAYSKFKSFIENGGPFVGHNISFDKRMIESNSRKSRVPIDIDIAFDTQRITEKLIHLPDYKLSNIINLLGLRGDLQSHSALDDVIGTFKLAKSMYEVYKNI